MLKELHISHVGPAPKFDFKFSERLNLVTGDNGLGKTFLLDAAWYALTRTWANGKSLQPPLDADKDSPPTLDFTVVGKTDTVKKTAKYIFANQSWDSEAKRPPMPGVVIYARVDGGFSVWDPARNYWKNENAGGKTRPASYQFTQDEVWDGKFEEGKAICNGLVSDVDRWSAKDKGSYELLQRVMAKLSADEEEQLELAESVQVDDVKYIPTIQMPYGRVPITLAASGVKRVLALAYLLVWAWDEHTKASEKNKEEPEKRIVVLFDEIEAHLHPKWQRVFLPALMEVIMSDLMKSKTKSVQFIVTTHSPQICASVESRVKPADDKLFHFELKKLENKKTGATEQPSVVVEEIRWAKQGDVISWLESGAFELPSGYSLQAEQAIWPFIPEASLRPSKSCSPGRL